MDIWMDREMDGISKEKKALVLAYRHAVKKQNYYVAISRNKQEG